VNIRRFLAASALYGIGDMLVLAVGGFLLLPLYTRTLSQAAFADFLIVKVNAEILQYVLYFGLLSSVARIYFDYKAKGRQREYLNSIVMFFLVVLLAAAVLLEFFGDAAWRRLAPQTTPRPYIWFCLALAAANFFAGIGSLWFRLDEQVKRFVTIQIVASAVTGIAAFVNLVVLKLGLNGLLIALILGYMPASAALFYRIGGKLRPVIHRDYVIESVRFGLPFAMGYIAYFVVNRFNLLTLQHYVPLDQIAVFGLAQQIATLVTLLGASLGKAIQPIVYGAPEEEAPELLRRSSHLYILLLFAVSALVVMFAREIILVVGSRSYLNGYTALLILLVGSYFYSLGFASNLALLYHRRPQALTVNSIGGAVISAGLGLLLVPRYHLIGGAIATSCAYLIMTGASFGLAYRLNRQSYFKPLILLGAAVCLLAVLSAFLNRLDWGIGLLIALKFILLGAVVIPACYVAFPYGIRRLCSSLSGFLGTR
jgi:O-antigen/teichoic acid export membrane protein